MASRSWVRQQMRDANVRPLVQAYVEELFNIYERWEYPKSEKDAAFEVFDKLRRDIALDKPRQVPEVWQAGRPGRFALRDEVRVRADAYLGEVGEIHNGRRGVIIAIRHGDILVKYEDGREPEIKDARHSPFNLEKRVQ